MVFVGEIIDHLCFYRIVERVLVRAQSVGRIGSCGPIVCRCIAETVGIEVDIVAHEVVADGLRHAQREMMVEDIFNFGLHAVIRRDLRIASPLVYSYAGLSLQVIVRAEGKLTCIGTRQLAVCTQVELALFLW